MPFLIFIVWPILEVFLVIDIAEQWGWGNTFLYLMFASVFGIYALKYIGQKMMLSVQKMSTQGVGASDIKILHQLLLALAALLLFIPGFGSDIFAVALALPGLRHLWIYMFGTRLKKFASSGRAQSFVFSMGPMGGAFYKNKTEGFGSLNEEFFKDQFSRSTRPNNDPNVIDVEAVEIKPHDELSAPKPKIDDSN